LLSCILIDKGAIYEFENSYINSLDWHNCAFLRRKYIYVLCEYFVPNFIYAGQKHIFVRLNNLSRQYHPFSCRVLFQTEGISEDDNPIRLKGTLIGLVFEGIL